MSVSGALGHQHMSGPLHVAIDLLDLMLVCMKQLVLGWTFDTDLNVKASPLRK